MLKFYNEYLELRNLTLSKKICIDHLPFFYDFIQTHTNSYKHLSCNEKPVYIYVISVFKDFEIGINHT